MAIKPLADRILVKPNQAVEKTKSGIILPGTAQEKPQEGKVVAIGKGIVAENGTIVPLDVKEGDKVLYGKYAGTEIAHNDEEFLILRQDDILAIVK